MKATLPPPNSSTTNQAAEPTPPAIWIRPPRGSEHCPYTGMLHGTFYRVLVRNSRIRQCHTAEGKRRGTRLLWLPDVHAELIRLAEAQALTGGARE